MHTRITTFGYSRSGPPANADRVYDVREGGDSKSYSHDEEEYEAELTKVQRNVQLTMTIFPALLFALLGILRWRVRESQRANISID